MTLPIWLKKAITDFLTAFVAGVTALSWAVPDPGNWRNWLITTGIALVNVAINAARRAWIVNAPEIIDGLEELTPEELRDLASQLLRQANERG